MTGRRASQLRLSRARKMAAADLRSLLRKRRRPRPGQAASMARFMATPRAVGAPLTETQRELFEKHDAAVVSLRLPLAPSVDHYLMLPGKGRRPIQSPEARAYRSAVRAFWLEHWKGKPPPPLTGRIRLLVVIGAARGGKWDLSNRVKPLEDALTACGAWLDDSQIDDERLLRGTPLPPTGYMDVTIEVITGPEDGFAAPNRD